MKPCGKKVEGSMISVREGGSQPEWGTGMGEGSRERKCMKDNDIVWKS